MPLTAGDKLGPYEIIAPIGKGGMGEVFRAHDPRTGRDVAIKISAERFSERFDREVRAVAALNHPNICTLFDVGASPNAPGYLVMEFIEGESPKGPMPLEEALRIAKQIADALKEAHEKNITHRDLKPGNIRVKPDGTVKVLDFGLAKIGNAPGVAPSKDSPTISMAATQAGMILGTAAYMAPEQAKGRPVDKRADIWAFGIVLHELLTGNRLFQHDDVTETLAAVVMSAPKLDDAPFEVRRLLKKCLEKDPKKRLQDIGDVWELLDAPVEQAPQAAVPPPRRLGGAPAWIAAALAIAVAAALGGGWWRAAQPVERPLIRLDVDLGADVSLPSGSNTAASVVLSPDGSRLVYASGNPVKLFLRRLDQPKSVPLPGTEGASNPFFSPDGQWIGFVARNKLNKISVEGGAVVPLADQPVVAGFSWGDDGSIIAGNAFTTGLQRFPSAGGAPVKVTDLNGEIAHAMPHLLPGNKQVLFASYAALDSDKATIDVVTLEDRKRKTLVRGATTPQYLAASAGAGYLIYNNKSTLFAIPFDPGRLETRGTAVPILDDLAFANGAGVAGFSLSQSGTLAYRKSTAGASSALSTIQWLDPAGKKSPLREKPGDYRNIALSPDGSKLALALYDGSNADIWIYEPSRDSMTRLTFGGGVFDEPVWSPDGRYVVFASIGSGLYWTRADGAGQPQSLTQGRTLQIPVSFAPDGKRLGYFEAAGAPQLWTVRLEDEGGQLKAGKAEQFLKTQFADLGPVFSPDGHWVAYQSNESGKPEVYVRAFPQPSSGQGGKWQISNDGGQIPVWPRNGHELFYRSGRQIMKVAYAFKGESFVNEKPVLWLDKLPGTTWSLAPDGKRVAVVQAAETAEAPRQDHEIVILFNFLDELRRKVPAGR